MNKVKLVLIVDMSNNKIFFLKKVISYKSNFKNISFKIPF